MIAILHERRGELPVDARIADMADFRPPAPFPFPLIYIAASTFYLLGSAERQRSGLSRRPCFDEGERSEATFLINAACRTVSRAS